VQVHTKRRAKRLQIDERELKLPVAVAFSACSANERDWPNVLSAHSGDSTAYTWQLSKYRCATPPLPNTDLVQPSFKHTSALICVCVRCTES
jgi:hypothetical protein